MFKLILVWIFLQFPFPSSKSRLGHLQFLTGLWTFLGAWSSSSAGSHPWGSPGLTGWGTRGDFASIPNFSSFPSLFLADSHTCSVWQSMGSQHRSWALSSAICDFLTESSPAQGLAALPTQELEHLCYETKADHGIRRWIRFLTVVLLCLMMFKVKIPCVTLLDFYVYNSNLKI